MKHTAKFLAIIPACALFFGTGAAAIDLGSFVGSGGKINVGSVGVPGVFGDTSATLKCRPKDSLNLDLPNKDLCKMNKAIDSFTGKFSNLSFDLGFCSVGVSDALKCQADQIKKMCAERANRPLKKVVSAVRTGERNINDAGRVNTVITGRDKVAKGSACDDVEKVIKSFPEHLKAQKDVTALSGTGAYGQIINTRLFGASKGCYEDMLKSGKSSSDAARYCSPYSIASAESGLTPKDIQDQSFKTAAETTKTPLGNSAQNASSDEAGLASMLSSVCGLIPSEAGIEICAEKVIEQTAKLPEKNELAIAQTETAEAGKVQLFNDATEHRLSLTHPTEEYKNKLPVAQRAGYAGASKRAMAQKALIASYNMRISEIKKETLTLLSQKKEMLARPFYRGAEAGELMKSVGSAASKAGSALGGKLDF